MRDDVIIIQRMSCFGSRKRRVVWVAWYPHGENMIVGDVPIAHVVLDDDIDALTAPLQDTCNIYRVGDVLITVQEYNDWKTIAKARAEKAKASKGSE